MKKIKLLFKTLNFLGSNACTTLRSSLAHTFRVDPKNTLGRQNFLKWDKHLMSANKLYLGKSFLNEKLGLNSEEYMDFSTVVSSGKNIHIVDAIVNHYQQPPNKGKLNQDLATARHKLNLVCQQLTNAAKQDAAKAINDFLKDTTLLPQCQTYLDMLPVELKPEKIFEKLERFKSLKEKISQYPSRKNTIVQEGILTFPLKDPLTVGFSKLAGELSADEIIYSMYCFLILYYGEFPIIAIVSHVDEVRLHIHFFIDGWGGGKLKQTIPEFIFERFNPCKDTAKSKPLSKSQQIAVGANFQACFYKFINNDLLSEKFIEAEVSSMEERNSLESKLRNQDSKKPILTREYQRLNEEFRLLKDRLAAMENKKRLLDDEMTNMTQKLLQQQGRYVTLTSMIEEQKAIVDYSSGEKLENFVLDLRDAVEPSLKLTNVNNTSQILSYLLTKYPKLKRDIWQDMFRIILGGEAAEKIIRPLK